MPACSCLLFVSYCCPDVILCNKATKSLCSRYQIVVLQVPNHSASSTKSGFLGIDQFTKVCIFVSTNWISISTWWYRYQLSVSAKYCLNSIDIGSNINLQVPFADYHPETYIRIGIDHGHSKESSMT